VHNSDEFIRDLKLKKDYAVKNVLNMYNKKLYFTAYRFVNNRESAEDVVQEVWLKFFKNIKSFRSESSLYTYLYRITVNESLRWLKKNKDTYSINDNIKYETASGKDDVFESLAEKEEKNAVVNAVTKLPEKQKSVVILRMENRLKYSEIAEILNISVNNAKALYSYAVKNIKKYLEEDNLL